MPVRSIPRPAFQQNALRSAEGMTSAAPFRRANRHAFNPFGNGQLRALPIATQVSEQMIRGRKRTKEKEYDGHSYTNRVRAAGRFREAVTRHFPELSQPGTVPPRTTSGTDRTGCRLEPLTMFRITTETCRTFTFAEVLIMAAMNVENALVSSEAASQPETSPQG